jgi:hypothetical protein
MPPQQGRGRRRAHAAFAHLDAVSTSILPSDSEVLMRQTRDTRPGNSDRMAVRASSVRRLDWGFNVLHHKRREPSSAGLQPNKAEL